MVPSHCLHFLGKSFQCLRRTPSLFLSLTWCPGNLYDLVGKGWASGSSSLCGDYLGVMVITMALATWLLCTPTGPQSSCLHSDLVKLWLTQPYLSFFNGGKKDTASQKLTREATARVGQVFTRTSKLSHPSWNDRLLKYLSWAEGTI